VELVVMVEGLYILPLIQSLFLEHCQPMVKMATPMLLHLVHMVVVVVVELVDQLK
jgi:hypothetical protein